jgi:hypothetical protein
MNEKEFDEVVVQAIDKIVCYKGVTGIWDVRQIAKEFTELFKAAIELYSTREEVESILNISGIGTFDFCKVVVVSCAYNMDGDYQITFDYGDVYKVSGEVMPRDEFIKLWKASKNT